MKYHNGGIIVPLLHITDLGNSEMTVNVPAGSRKMSLFQ